jgi:hypothetical protein
MILNNRGNQPVGIKFQFFVKVHDCQNQRD